MLNTEQINQFWGDGFLVVENAVTATQLTALWQHLNGWIEESRHHNAPFGPPTLDNRPRFDMGAEHTRDNPALRRVNNPSDICGAYLDVMRHSAMTDMVTDLIGPDVKFHHCKINLKLPGSKTEVGYHQDFLYTPHTNDDIVTALLMLDDMTESNGCLTVVPGTHQGSLYSLFDNDRFTGTIAADVVRELKPKEVPVYGKAGSVCLMHTRVVHGSAANRSQHSRGLYICVYTAADAFPLAANPMPNPNEGAIIRGKKTRIARLQATAIELPEQPKMASFFAVQGQQSAAAS